MGRYSIKLRKRKHVKRYGFLSFARKLKKIIGFRTRCCKNDLEKVVQKAGEILGDQISDPVTNSNDHKIVKPNENPRNVEETIIPLEKRDEILTKLRKAL